MANITSVSQTYIETSKGNMPLLLIDLDSPVETGYAFGYNGSQYGTCRLPIINFNNVDTPFTMDNLSYANGVISFTYEGVSDALQLNLPSPGYAGCYFLGIIHGTDDKYRVWIYENAYYANHLADRVNNSVDSFGSCLYNSSGWYDNYTAATNLEKVILANYFKPEYTWSPVTHLSGNNSQFYLPLSQINAEDIGDGETYVSTDDASKVILTNQSKIYNLLINIPNNIETILAYCGGNYVTVTRQYVTGQQQNAITYILKFYYRSDLMIYETPQLAINDPPGTDYYLSFIVDVENQVAALDMILHLKSIDHYGWNSQALPSEQDMHELYVWLQDNGQEHPIATPYDTGSTDDGGEPNNPRPQDHITDSTLPTTGGLNMGIITLYCPDDTELAAISTFLWSDDVLDNFKKYFNNFADNILCLYTLPFKPDSLPTKAFTVGKVASQNPALAAVNYCTTRYYDIDMGSVTLDSRWGAYLDYSPYTKLEIYLPYVGIHSLDIDEFMSPTKMDGTAPDVQGCIISLVYRLDIVTGLIVAKVKITSGGGISNEIRYQFTGKVGSNIPLTGQTFSNLINGIVTAGAGLASTIATGGLTAPMSAAATVTATIQAQKPAVTSIGNISGDASMLATDVPYLRITSPNKPLLEDQQVFTGFPSYKAGTLTNFSGYTEVIDAHVEGISCTEEERAKILTYLKDGVII